MLDFKVLALSELKAANGRFRPVSFIDSEPYLFREDQETPEAALNLLHSDIRNQVVGIYDDQGKSCLQDGKIIVPA